MKDKGGMAGVDVSAAGIVGVWRSCGNQSDKTGREDVIEGTGGHVAWDPNLRVGVGVF